MDIRDALDSPPDTEHGLLVAYGQFARQIGLLEHLRKVPVPVKTRIHTPQAKLTEFLVGILSGIEYLQDLDLAPRPLTKDRAVARAWDQPNWAHYSGVSRTLDAADDQTVTALQKALQTTSQPFIDEAIDDQLRCGTPLVFDADLTGQPVSSTSRTYPDAAFGWMDDGVRLGYQLARVSLQTQRYGRLWLAGFHHPGSTVSVACLRELVEAAEQATGVRPRRRIELLHQRIDALARKLQGREALVQQRETAIHQLEVRLERLRLHLALASLRLGDAATPTLPKSLLALGASLLAPDSRAYHQLVKQRATWEEQRKRAEGQLVKAQQVLAEHQRQADLLRQEREMLGRYLARLETDNATNPSPPVCILRVDAGFASGENLAWLIEMGYQVYTKAPNSAGAAAPAWSRPRRACRVG